MVYDNGWVACTTPRRLPWQAAADSSPDDFKWGLYNIAEDFSEANNHAHAYRNTNSYSYTETSDDLPEQAR